MRIEQQGYTTVQPSYQHVGYISAGVKGAYLNSNWLPTGTATLAAVLLLAVGASVALRHRRRVAPVLRAAGLMILGAWLCLGAPFLALAVPARLAPETHRTLYHLEEASALTDEWVSWLGRPPTAEEWDRLIAGHECAFDGWGQPLLYRVSDDRRDRGYVIAGGQRRPRDGAPSDGWLSSWGLSTRDLGPDAVFGTEDDQGILADRGDWHTPGRYEHGRAPRTGGVSP